MILNALLVIIICAVIYKIQESVYRNLWDRNLSVEIEYLQPSAFEGETVGFAERLINRKRFPLSFIKVNYILPLPLKQTDTAGNETYADSERNTVFFVPGNKSITRRSLLECRKRGYYTIDKASVETANVFLVGFLSMKTAQNAVLTVYPKEIDVSDMEIPYRQFLGDILAKRFILPDPFVFVGVREYQPFDTLRQINFKAWARTGSLMSNIYGYTVSQEVKIFLNMEKYALRYREDVYENAIRLAAFLAKHYMQEGVPVRFVTNGVDCVTGVPASEARGHSEAHLREVYETLARINITKSLYTESIINSLPEKQEDDASIILISSLQNDELFDWHSNIKSSGGHVLWIVPCVHDEMQEVRAGNGIVTWEVPND